MILVSGIIFAILWISSKFTFQSHEAPTLFQRVLATVAKTFVENLPLWVTRLFYDSVGWFEQAVNGFLFGKRRRKWCREAKNAKNWKAYLIAEGAQNSEVGDNADIVVLYAHGGGYVAGNALLPLVVFVRWIKYWKSSHKVKTHILSLEYGLSPENSFPVARDNMIDCYLWLVNERKINPSKIVFAGDSAGGNLATISALYILHNPTIFSLPPPSALLLISPCFSALTTSPSFQKNKQHDVLSIDYFHYSLKQYLGDSNQSPTCPLVSPIFHDKLNGMPKIWTCIGGYEIMLDDVIKFIEKARLHNVKAELVVAPHNLHDYAVVWPISRDNAAELAMKSMGNFLFC